MRFFTRDYCVVKFFFKRSFAQDKRAWKKKRKRKAGHGLHTSRGAKKFNPFKCKAKLAMGWYGTDASKRAECLFIYHTYQRRMDRSRYKQNALLDGCLDVCAYVDADQSSALMELAYTRIRCDCNVCKNGGFQNNDIFFFLSQTKIEMKF